ncbi:hypothetical protein SNA_11145 [Streptomyces natalensis ATCC 27448]|uniref:Transposase n=1 Tax=Streptomyces natalensis ATCC 27448 TaxID=1240678 RepID=A0A0D7CPF3_9ACTN|nr:hypothetical protein SNA_11145 [Streptomyces natalensis ATCC 27448]
MTAHDVEPEEVARLRRHLQLLHGVERLFDVAPDVVTVRWLLRLTCDNGELAARSARRVLADMNRRERGVS